METVVTPQDIAFNQSVLPHFFSALGQDEVLRWGLVDGLGLVFAFPGTENKIFDWAENFRFGKTLGYHTGFFHQCTDVLPTIFRVLTEEKPNRVLFTGYSQGAAVAQIALNMCRKKNYLTNENSSAVVFASPRCMSWFNRRREHVILYEYGNDIVTRLPPWVFGYRKTGLVVHMGPLKRFFKLSIKDHLPEGYKK